LLGVYNRRQLRHRDIVNRVVDRRHRHRRSDNRLSFKSPGLERVDFVSATVEHAVSKPAGAGRHRQSGTEPRDTAHASRHVRDLKHPPAGKLEAEHVADIHVIADEEHARSVGRPGRIALGRHTRRADRGNDARIHRDHGNLKRSPSQVAGDRAVRCLQ